MKRRADFDVLRVLCMCAVVYLHAASSSFYRPENRPLWIFCLVVNVLASLAVPLFFMLSGALALAPGAKAEPLFVLRRRVGKVLVPLVMWSGVCLLYLWQVQNDPAGAWSGAKSILSTPANVAYWFLYALIPMYLLIPALKPAADNLDRRGWRYLLLLWLILTLALPTAREFLPEGRQAMVKLHPTLNLDAVGGYLGYFLLGAYLDRLERLPRRSLLIWGTVLATALIGTLALSDSFAQGAWSSRFTGYLNVFTALRAAGVFLLFKSLLGHRETRSKLVLTLSGCSFCVYLAHPVVVMETKALRARFVDPKSISDIPQQLALYLVVLAVCVLGALVLDSIPVLCRLFTGQSFRSACQSSNLWALFAKRETTSPLDKPKKTD